MSADAGTLGAGLDPPSHFVQSLHSCQTEQLRSLPSRERMEPDTYTKVSIFYNQLPKPYVGFYSTTAFRDTLVWKDKLANLRYFFARVCLHTRYLPT